MEKKRTPLTGIKSVFKYCELATIILIMLLYIAYVKLNHETKMIEILAPVIFIFICLLGYIIGLTVVEKKYGDDLTHEKASKIKKYIGIITAVLVILYCIFHSLYF